jgi:SNF family Na+-dependent transporter
MLSLMHITMFGHNKMKIKRKVVLAIIVVAISLLGQVCAIPGHDRYVETILSFVLALIAGTIIAVVFMAVSSVGAWFMRNKTDRIKLVSDCLWFVIFAIPSFVGGFSARVLQDSAL